MKKITTFFAVAALLAFALIFAATNYPNSPPVAESFQLFDFTEQLKTQAIKRLPSDYVEMGDNPISTLRNKDYSNTRQVYLNFTDEPPKENPKFTFANYIYKSPDLNFRGFGTDAQARSKI